MNLINLILLFQSAQKPPVFAKSTASLWDDEHISKGMLEAHLDPDNDAASRKPEFIDASVRWIIQYTGIQPGARILDLGCGPGLYAERFARRGYGVTGVDFSRRSLAYAKDRAAGQGLEIKYLYQDYLTDDLPNEMEYDVIILIYCDLGVFSDEDAQVVLKKAYSSLKPGGCLIFDVFTPVRFLGKQESEQNWQYQESGFWRPNPHLCLYAHYAYPEDDTRLDQYIIMDDQGGIEVYRNWDHYYTRETISKVLLSIGFTGLDFFADVTGKEDDEKSETLCVVGRKGII